MDKFMPGNEKMSTGATVLVILNFILHLPSLFLLGFGLLLTIGGFFSYTGITAIFGIPMAVFGFIFWGGIRASVLLFVGGPRGLKSIVHFSS